MKNFTETLLNRALERGITEAEVYEVEHEKLLALVNDGAISDLSQSVTGGISLRGLYGTKMGTAYSEVQDEEALDMLLDGVIESAKLIETNDPEQIFPGSPLYPTVDTTGDTGSVEERLQFAIALDVTGRATDPRVTQMGVYTGLQSEVERIRIQNTHGLSLECENTVVIGIASAVAKAGERVTSGFSVVGAYNLADLSAKTIAQESVADAVRYLDAKSCPSGNQPVVIRNGAMADLLGAFSSIFSADSAQKGRSLLKDKENTVIAAACVTLIDDPLLAGGFATRAFDGEGVATYTKSVVQDGTLKTLLHNLKTATKQGVTTTGNAARGLTSPVVVAPTNFFFQPGTQTLAQLENAMGNGLVICEMDGLHAGTDATSGDFSLLCKGYLVENGGPARAVEQITVAGNFFTLLQNIVAVGNDIKFPMGPIGSPSIWVSSLSIAGGDC